MFPYIPDFLFPCACDMLPTLFIYLFHSHALPFTAYNHFTTAHFKSDKAKRKKKSFT